MKKLSLELHRVELLYAISHIEGFMYLTPILMDGDTSDEPLRSKVVLFEDGKSLRRAHEHHSTIIGTGRGAYSHWDRSILFSTSDNSDPRKNGRAYSYAIDYAGQHETQDDGKTYLHPPFYLQGGLCWGVAITDEGDDMGRDNVSQLRLYEDDRPLGPSHAQHVDITLHGGGIFSHWKYYLYFSTSDGTNPNTNGRLYRYELQTD